MKLIKMVFAVIIFAVAACAEDKSKLKPFDYEKCKYSEGFSYEECMDLQLYKAFGKDWYKVKEFWFEFQNAVKNNDKEKLADMMDYPLDLFHLNKFVAPDDRERDVKLMVIKNKEEFLEKFDFIFNKKFKKNIIEKSYTDMIVWGKIIRSYSAYSSVYISKRCDFKKIKPADCKNIKVYWLNNDAVTMEEIDTGKIID